jgi:hypothetical protein
MGLARTAVTSVADWLHLRLLAVYLSDPQQSGTGTVQSLYRTGEFLGYSMRVVFVYTDRIPFFRSAFVESMAGDG